MYRMYSSKSLCTLDSRHAARGALTSSTSSNVVIQSLGKNSLKEKQEGFAWFECKTDWRLHWQSGFLVVVSFCWAKSEALVLQWPTAPPHYTFKMAHPSLVQLSVLSGVLPEKSVSTCDLLSHVQNRRSRRLEATHLFLLFSFEVTLHVLWQAVLAVMLVAARNPGRLPGISY